MSLTKQGEFTKKVTDLPDTPSPSYTPTEIKTYFQNPSDELAQTHNDLVDELTAPTGASELGAKDIDNTTTTIQALLSKNANGLKTHKEASVLDHPDKSVTTAKLADKAVTRGKIGTGAVGLNELDPSITDQPNTEVGYQAKFAELDARLAETSNLFINPDQFEGTDLEKLQSAFDFSKDKQCTITLGRMYDITGGSIVIKKAGDFRVPTYVNGSGIGGIKKTDAGFMFVSPVGAIPNVSDHVFNQVFFEGVSTANVKIFDCDTLIRIRTECCYFKRITNVFYTSDTGFLQSIRMSKDTVVGIPENGYVLDFAGAYDVVVDKMLLESSVGSLINHRYIGINKGVYGVKIRDCALEGITGTHPVMTFKGQVESLLIDGNYFEENAGGHIVFDPLTEMNHVTVSNNRHGGNDVTHLIKWGKMAKGCFAYNNATNNIGIHDASAITDGRILSFFDKPMPGATGVDIPNNRIDYVKYEYDAVTIGVNSSKSIFGSIVKLTSKLNNQVIPANTTITLTFSFDENVYLDDTITFQIIPTLDNRKITVNYFYRDTDKTMVKATITNADTTDTTLSIIQCTVVKVNTTLVG